MGKGVKRGEWQERMTGDSENADTRGGNEGNGHCKKRKVNKFNNVDVECTVFENGQEAFDFEPTNRERRIRQCLRFNLPGPLHLPERIPSRHACQEFANPKQVDHIVGDGNCLYRAINLEVFGTQNENEAVRELIIDTMIRNEKSFSKYVGVTLGITSHNIPSDPDLGGLTLKFLPQQHCCRQQLLFSHRPLLIVRNGCLIHLFSLSQRFFLPTNAFI